MNLIQEIIGDLPNALVVNEFDVSHEESYEWDDSASDQRHSSIVHHLNISANLPRVPDHYVFPKSIAAASFTINDVESWHISDSPAILAFTLIQDSIKIKNYESHTIQLLMLADPESITRLRCELLEMAEKQNLLICVSEDVVFISLA